MQLLGRRHTVLSNSTFSSPASCFLMKERTAWTASGSATSIMSIISPSPGKVNAFATNSWKNRCHRRFISTFTLPSIFKKKNSSYFIQAWVAEYASEPMHKVWIQNQWLVLLEISHQAEHQLACQQLSSLPTEQKNNQVNNCPSVALLLNKNGIAAYRKTNRLNSSESWARRKDRSLSVRSDSRRIGEL